MSATKPAEQCEAAHADDWSECDGPRDAVVINDGWIDQDTTGCLRHGAVLLASLQELHRAVRPGPGAREGDAITVYERAQALPPFAWEDIYDRALSIYAWVG